MCEMTPIIICRLCCVVSCVCVTWDHAASPLGAWVLGRSCREPRPAPACTHLRRSDDHGPWTDLDLTVDIIAATDMPPLFSCKQTNIAASQKRGAICGVSLPQQKDFGEWLKLCDGSGRVVGTFEIQKDGCCQLLRAGQHSWEMELWPDEDCWLVIRKNLQELAITMCQRVGGKEFLQVDVQPGPESPDSALLLFCTLAMLVLRY